MKDENVIRITKFLLDFMYYAGMAVTVSLIWLVKWIADFFNYAPFVHNYREVVIIYTVLGILAILIIGELRKIFRTVLEHDSFVIANVFSLKRMGTYSFFIAALCLVRFFLYQTIAMAVLILVFVIAGLFSKVLAFVFEQAITYKEENDLTI